MGEEVGGLVPEVGEEVGWRVGASVTGVHARKP